MSHLKVIVSLLNHILHNSFSELPVNLGVKWWGVSVKTVCSEDKGFESTSDHQVDLRVSQLFPHLHRFTYLPFVSFSCHFRPYMNSAGELLLNDLRVNIPHPYSLFSCDCCSDADRYCIVFVAVLLAVFNVDSVVLYSEVPRRKSLLIRENDTSFLQNVY